MMLWMFGDIKHLLCGRGCGGVAQGWWDAGCGCRCFTRFTNLCWITRGEEKELSVPRGRAAELLGLDVCFPWAGVRLAAQGVLTNHRELSSRARRIFIRLGNGAFTHAGFGKGSLLSSCLGLGSAGGRAAAELRGGRQLSWASPGGVTPCGEAASGWRGLCTSGLPRHPSQQPRTRQVRCILSAGVPSGRRGYPLGQRGLLTRGF